MLLRYGVGGYGPVFRAAITQCDAALRRHVDALAAKDYWSAFDESPRLVVCFVPSEWKVKWVGGRQSRGLFSKTYAAAEVGEARASLMDRVPGA